MSPLLVFLVLALTSVAPNSSDAPVVVSDAQQFYDIGRQTSILIDQDGRWSIEDVTGDSLAARFSRYPDSSPHFGYSSAAYWIRFAVDVRTDSDWLLEVAEKSLDHVEFYTSLAARPSLKGGDGIPFHDRPVRHRRLLFPLPHAGEYEVYLRVQTAGPVKIPLRIWSEAAMATETRKEEFALGIFFGILLIMVLYNLVLYASLRDLSYVLFALFIASFGFYQASVERIAFEYLWPENLWWMDRANSLLAVFCAGWALLFSRSFLDTRRYAPTLDRVLIGLAAFCVVFLIVVAVGPIRILNEVVVYFFILMAPVVLVSAVVCVLNRDKAAIYYLTGWTILLIAVPAGMFGYLGFLSDQISGITSVRFGAFTGIVLLSQIGLGYRYDQMRREREALRLRLARDLHDEIGTALTEISLYSELIQRDSKGNAATWAGDMGNLAREMTGRMQDMVWAIHPGREGWHELEVRMKDFTSRLLAPQNIAFEMKGEAVFEPERLSLEVRKNLLLIYKEIVHNAVRHANCSRITVRYHLSRRQFRMQVCDDGRGFDPNTVRENNGLRNLQSRAREIHANLELETHPGGPTCYSITMPFTPSHLNE